MKKDSINYSIEIAKPEDEVVINLLIESSFSTQLIDIYGETLLTAVLPNLSQINPVLLTSGTYYLAKNNFGDLFGCGGWTHERPGTTKKKKSVAHLRHYATSPDYYNLGVGRAIYNHCVKAAKKEGVKTFECYSTLNAERFYQSLGFKTIKIFDLDMGNGATLPTVSMRAKI